MRLVVLLPGSSSCRKRHSILFSITAVLVVGILIALSAYTSVGNVQVLGNTMARIDEEAADLDFQSSQQRDEEKGTDENILSYSHSAIISNVSAIAAQQIDDPFKLWSRRNQISLNEIQSVLQRLESNTTCRRNALFLPSSRLSNGSVSSLEQLAAAMQRKLATSGNKTLVIGVLGDSVSADLWGWVEAFQSFLNSSPLVKSLGFQSVTVRNYAKGAAGARFLFYCNDLQGDEDIVIFENVRPWESEDVYTMVNSLQKAGYGILLINWRGTKFFDTPRSSFGFEKAARDFNVPTAFLNENEDAARFCLPPNANLSKTARELIYRDEIHPNRLGEITIASAAGLIVEDSISSYLDTNNPKKLTPLVEKSLSSFDAVCYSHLECSDNDLKAPPTGTRRCLVPTDVQGFRLGHTKESGKLSKTWWEGNEPGDSIEFQLDESCSSIVLFYNRRPITNGMVEIKVDGGILNSSHQTLENEDKSLPPGTLDGWFKGFSWLPKHRGFLKEQVIAHDMEPDPHSVMMEIQNITNAENGTFKFDFVALACKKG